MKTASLLSSLSLAALGTCTNVLLPLYIYPTADAFEPVYSAISSNPDVTYYVVLDPDSGPGGGQYPSSDYITAVAKFNSYSNVQTIGYVHTAYMDETTDAVNANVTIYAGWSGYTDSDISVKGIFFDEATDTESQTAYDYMSTVASNARDKGLDYVIFNPGTAVTAPQFFDAADLIVISEISYSAYQGSTMHSVPQQYWNQSAVILHNTPSGADLTSVTSGLQSDGLSAFYATGDCCYQSVSMIGDVSSALAA